MDVEAAAWVPSLPAEVVGAAEGEEEVVVAALRLVAVVEAAEGVVVAAEDVVVVDAGVVAEAGDAATDASDGAYDAAGAVAVETGSAVGASAHSNP